MIFLSNHVALAAKHESLMPEESRISYCPHCGNTSPHHLVHTQPYLERLWSTSDPKDHIDEEAVYFVAVCKTCNEVLVYGGLKDSDAGEFDGAVLVWPQFGLDHAVPERIRQIYEEASRIENIAPNAFAVQIRRALEAVCIDRGATRGSLVQNIHELANRGEIPKTLVEASDLLRLIGNIGAHAGDRDVHRPQAHSLDRFFRAIVEYLYVSPKRIEQFRASLEKARKQVTEHGDH
jgi:Domain of unknown function (DUF4145)